MSVVIALFVTLTPLVSPAAQATAFKAWLLEVENEAVANGLKREAIAPALSSLEPIARVIELDRRQPEGRLSFVEYRERVVTDARIQKGRRLLAQHGGKLSEIERRYGVPAEVIVALWGIESSFGEFRGRFPVVGSLATLAYDGRRAE